MTYEDIWEKIKRMKQWERSMLAYEMMFKGFNVGYIHPHYYFDAKAIHDIVFYAPHKQWEIEDPPQPSLEGGSSEDSDSKGYVKLHDYYLALKGIVENDKEIHIRVKRHAWLPRSVNDWREGKIVRKYICSRINKEYVNSWYRILPGKNLAGESSRSLFITLGNGEEVIYKMTECKNAKGVEEMTFQRTNK